MSLKKSKTAFLWGYASAFDLSGRLFLPERDTISGPQRDKQVLALDLAKIGNDFRTAMGVVINERDGQRK